MRPISDEDLILHYYDEADDPEAIRRELERSPDLATRYRELSEVLDAVGEVEGPEPWVGYGERLWRQLEPRVAGATPGRSWRWLGSRWGVAAAAALLVSIGIFVGRITSPPVEPPTATTASQRILMDTVAGHLLRAEILLLELANARDGEGLDLSAERDLARELSKANRLYRQTARSQGQRRTAALLDDLELLFLEVAHTSDPIHEDDLAEIRRRLDERDLLFKVQVVGARLRRTTEPAPTDA